jgi:hypothetical protein
MKVLTIGGSQGAGDIWMDGALEVRTVAKVAASTARNLVQTAQLLTASVKKLGQGNGDG